MSNPEEVPKKSWELNRVRRYSKDIILLIALFTLGFSTRLLIAPYTSHGYDINVHKTWLFRLLDTGIFFYVSPEGMGMFGKSWGHDPIFCELPPIYPFTLFLVGKLYIFLRPNLEDIYLLVLLMKLPQIIAECGIAVLIYHIVRRETDLRLGACATLLFLINPFTFFLTAVWGAPESLVTIFVIASIYAAYRSRYFIAASLLGVSLIVKPYPIMLLIPLLLLSYPDLRFLKTLALPLITGISAVITSLPWLIVQKSLFITAMWAGAVHNLGIRMWEGTIWAFPSFWEMIRFVCDISGFPYEFVAPFEFYIYLLLTLILCYAIIRLRANLEKKNIWFMAYLFLFSFMMFMPSAHEKWEYACFPLIIISTFLKREKIVSSLLMYAGLTFTFFEGIYGSCEYFFTSTEVLPMPRNFVYGGVFAELWYDALWSASRILAAQFSFLPYAVFSILIFFFTLKQALTSYYPPTVESKAELSGFMARSRKSSGNVLEKGLVFDPFQRRLDTFQTLPEKEQTLPTQAASIEQIEDETNGKLKAFESSVKEAKETYMRLQELTRLFKSDAISENAYLTIVGELGDQISMSVEKMCKLREILELDRAKANVERAKEKIALKEFETPERQMVLKDDAYLRRQLYSPLYRWEDIISKIDAVLLSLTMEEETSIIEQYLSLTKEWYSSKARSDEVNGSKAMCQQRLNSISEKWASTRRDKIEQVMNLELKAFQNRDDVKEVEVRFAVGELDQKTYEYRMSTLQESLKKAEKEIHEIRNHIEGMDIRIFRCLELLRENPERNP